jgi:hypothetical protein
LHRRPIQVGRLKVAAAAVAGSWLLVIPADVVLAELASAHLVVAALALGNTIGQTIVAIPLGESYPPDPWQRGRPGVGHEALAGLAACAVGAVVGVAVSVAVP